jgi:eukaryotic-like serine/threonine-protein kinase
MDMARAADSLAKVYLGVRLPRPAGFTISRGWPKIYKGCETLCLEAALVKQHADSISDDGKWVLATTNAEGGPLVLLPTGAGEQRPIKTGNLHYPIGRFLPDGKRILIVSDGRAYVQSLESDSPRPVTPPGIFAFRQITADGEYVLGRDEHQNWALYPIEGGQPVPLPKWTSGDLPVQHTTDSHSFFLRNGDLPVNIYRFNFITGSRQFVRQLRLSDPTGMERLSSVLMTPDGKYYVYGGQRELSNLFVVTNLGN